MAGGRTDVAPAGAAITEFYNQDAPEYWRMRRDWHGEIFAQGLPVFWSAKWGGHWVVIGHEEALAVLRDWETFSSKAIFAPDGSMPLVDGICYPGLFKNPVGARRPMLETDPPEHSKLRSLFSPEFSVSAMMGKRDRIQQFADACLDRCILDGRMDLSRDFAVMIPTLVTLEFLGIPLENYGWIADLHHNLPHVDEVEQSGYLGLISRENELIAAAVAQAEPLANRSGSLISTLLNARDSGISIDNTTIREAISLLLAAGIDTTASVTASTLVLMSGNPKLKHRLASEPGLMASAFAEFVRYAAPTQGLFRTVTRDVELGGQRLQRGDRILVHYSAACRDPRAFPDHDELNLTRRPNLNLAFGAGVHRCLGTPLARVEFEIMIRTILARIPDFVVDEDSAQEFEKCDVVVGWRTVPATFTPGRQLGVDPEIPGWEACR